MTEEATKEATVEVVGAETRLSAGDPRRVGGRFWLLASDSEEEEGLEVEGDGTSPMVARYLTTPMEDVCRTPSTDRARSLGSSARGIRRLEKRKAQRYASMALLFPDSGVSFSGSRAGAQD